METWSSLIFVLEGSMAVFEIVDYCGNVIEYVGANNERQALCTYVTNHEELIDIILWKAPTGMWKLAEYDSEDFYLFARKVCNMYPNLKE